MFRGPFAFAAFYVDSGNLKDIKAIRILTESQYFLTNFEIFDHVM